MTSLLDLWRAVDPEARLVSGSVARLVEPARGVLLVAAAVAGDVLLLDLLDESRCVGVGDGQPLHPPPGDVHHG